jgi:hypothetical protein
MIAIVNMYVDELMDMNNQHSQEIEQLQRENGVLRMEIARLSNWQREAELSATQLQRVRMLIEGEFPDSLTGKTPIDSLRTLIAASHELRRWENWAWSHVPRRDPKQATLPSSELRRVLTNKLSLLVSIKAALCNEDHL